MDLYRDLAIPPQLANLLEKAKDFRLIHTPNLNVKEEEGQVIPEEEGADLPNEIDQFPFSRYVRENFKDASQWGVLSNALRNSITKVVADRDAKQAVIFNRLLLRFMLDKGITGADLKLYADYVANMVLSNNVNRDEALAQIASLTWNNYDDAHKGRLWVLLSHCLSCIMPSSQLHTFILKYVSDHGIARYGALLQQKLLRMPPQNYFSAENRLFPPCVLEWQSNVKCTPIAIKTFLPDGSEAVVEVNSWSTAEEVANRALEKKFRMSGSVQGWSLVLENESGQMIELSGHDYLFDVFSYLEIFPELESPPHEFLVYRSGGQSNGSFDPSEFLSPEQQQSAMNGHSNPEHMQGFRKQPSSAQSSFSSNFSYGPPNIRMSNDPYAQYRRQSTIHNVHADPSSGQVKGNDLLKRVKGGGKMMQPMTMGGGMMMQPQMMPMMQSPMMQNPMMQNPMMQNPMMQNPMMQNPMMQQPQMMMQPQMMPMQSMPMMQPQMSMPMQQQMPMAMPSSIGMMSSAMDLSSKQQSKIEQQMEKLLKRHEEQAKEMKDMKKFVKEVKKSKDESDSEEERSYRRRSKKNDKKYRRHSSDEDRRPSRRHRHRRSSEEDEPRQRRNSGHRPEVAAAVFGAASYTKRKESSEKSNPPFRQQPPKSPDPKEEQFKRSFARPPPKDESLKQDDEDIPEINSEGQGTVRMSFNEKRKFFLQKAMAESQPPPRRPPPKKIELPKSEKKQPPPKQESDKESGETEPIVRKESWKKPPVTEEEDTHKEALKLALAAAKKNHDKTDTALLNRQRREAARKQSTAKKPPVQHRSPSPPPKQMPPPVVNKLVPQRMTPVKETKSPEGPAPPKVPTPPSSPDSSPPRSPSPPASTSVHALAAALAARKAAQAEKEQEPPPLPPPIEIPPEPIPNQRPAMPSDDMTRTVKHTFKNRLPLTYANVKWRLCVRKEIFIAGEHLKDAEMANLLFRQIAHESQKGNPRILPADRDDIKQRLAKNGKIENSAIKSILKTCQEAWLFYFTQTFRIKVQEMHPNLPKLLYEANAIGVGQTGIHFIKMSGGTEWQTQSYNFNVLSQVKVQRGIVLEFLIEGMSVALHCRKSNLLKKVIHSYLVNNPPKKMNSPPITPRQEIESYPEQEDTAVAPQEPQENIYEVLPAPKGTEFSLEIYAEQNFKKMKEVGRALVYSKAALTKTLHDIQEPEKEAAALQCFRLIQQFMGDASSKSTSDEMAVTKLLQICNKHRSDLLLNEVYIYFAKQLTDNKKSKSCMLGWRLFSLFVSYFTCSKTLMPHLLAHLHKISDGDEETASYGAKVCLINFQQTVTYGGRKLLPSDVEVKALLIGHTTHDNAFLIPGWGDTKFKINTSMVILQAITHFCTQLGVDSENDMKEFGVFAIIMGNDGKMINIVPQKRNVYLMDILNDMHQKNTQCLLAFQRVVWKNPVNYDNIKLVLMLFNQIVPEYIDGKFFTYRELTDGLTKAQLTEISKIGALIHRGFEASSLPSQEQVKSCIPRKAMQYQTEFIWREQAQNQFTSIQNKSSHEARSEVLALLSNKKMFGASFFSVEMNGKMKMIAIDAKHLHVFDPENQYIEAEHELSTIANVSSRVEAENSFCDISFRADPQLSLKTKKAELIAGVLNHHIALS